MASHSGTGLYSKKSPNGGTFVAAAEIMEDLVKIKWGKAAGAVVSIFDRRLELMKAELSNPAKEISYIVKAQERFEG